MKNIEKLNFEPKIQGNLTCNEDRYIIFSVFQQICLIPTKIHPKILLKSPITVVKEDRYRLLQGFPIKFTLGISTKVKIAFCYRTSISKAKGDTQ